MQVVNGNLVCWVSCLVTRMLLRTRVSTVLTTIIITIARSINDSFMRLAQNVWHLFADDDDPSPPSRPHAYLSPLHPPHSIPPRPTSQ